MKEIGEFKDGFFYLSNFFLEPDGTNVEAEFQSRKTGIPKVRRAIAKLDPHEAKRKGNGVVLRKDWEQVKVPIMARYVARKFRQHTELKDKLMWTGRAMLREGNSWHDNFWGDCRCIRCRDKPGHNTLGVILMSIREMKQGGHD
jgi:ribA/ribD-fused uncharacterized protein